MGPVSNALYFITDALGSLRANTLTALFTSVTLGFALAIFALFALLFMNLNFALGTLGDRTNVVVYFDGATKGAEVKKYSTLIEAAEGVRSVTYVSSATALGELKSEFGGQDLFSGIDSAMLPASFEVMIETEYREPEDLAGVVAGLKKLKWVESVEYSAEWAATLSSVLRFVEVAALAFGLFLAIATIFIITNTIRLTVYARRDEIEVMRLVGASDFFIKAPFFIEGVVQGLFGGLISLGLLLLWRWILAANIPDYLSFMVVLPASTVTLLIILVLAGVATGVAGSFISMAKFMKI
ncbi:MAG: ABC transporter permease [Proteobacteria bacterium]|nr:ABC transporter permease [Pseudomonadota bacterium]